jgi:hypothetical protein
VSVVDLDEETAEHSQVDHLITTNRQWPSAKAMKPAVSIEQLSSHCPDVEVVPTP